MKVLLFTIRAVIAAYLLIVSAGLAAGAIILLTKVINAIPA